MARSRFPIPRENLSTRYSDRLLDTQFLADQDHTDPPFLGRLASVNNDRMPADSPFMKTIGAFPCFNAGTFDRFRLLMFHVMPQRIDRRDDIMDPVQGFIDIRNDLVGAGDNDDLLRAENHCGDSIAGPVNAHQSSIQRNGIGTGQEYVGE